MNPLESLGQFLRENVAPPLKELHAPLDEFLISLKPGVWVACAILFLAVGPLFVLFLKHDFVYRGAPSRALWRDLRLWAIIFTIPFMLLYYFFG